jgi:hypothetical protein
LRPTCVPEEQPRGNPCCRGNTTGRAPCSTPWSAWPAATSPNAPAFQDLAVAEAQLRDYQARIGQPFAHDGYLHQLTALRDQLKAGLSGATSQEDEPTVPELAERIKGLRAAHTVEATPERTGKRRTQAELPITARIRRRAETPSPPGQLTALQSEGRQGSPAEGAW